MVLSRRLLCRICRAKNTLTLRQADGEGTWYGVDIAQGSLFNLPSSKETITTVGISTRRPVGGTPGNSHSIGIVCVQR
jgi:hypothetical protein